MNALKYFTINEMIRSSKAKQYKIDNRPNEEQEKNIHALIMNVLDPLREAFGKPICVNSGFRCEELNALVGGVKNSHHLCNGGYAAADLNTRTKKGNRRLFELAQELDLPFCQLIDKYNATWIHISYNPDDIRKEAFYSAKK